MLLWLGAWVKVFVPGLLLAMSAVALRATNLTCAMTRPTAVVMAAKRAMGRTIPAAAFQPESGICRTECAR